MVLLFTIFYETFSRSIKFLRLHFSTRQILAIEINRNRFVLNFIIHVYFILTFTTILLCTSVCTRITRVFGLPAKRSSYFILGILFLQTTQYHRLIYLKHSCKNNHDTVNRSVTRLFVTTNITCSI